MTQLIQVVPPTKIVDPKNLLTPKIYNSRQFVDKKPIWLSTLSFLKNGTDGMIFPM